MTHKGLAVYRSKYGAAKVYSALLHEETDCDVLPLDKYRGPESADYDWCVFIGGIYAGGIGGIRQFQTRYQPVPGQKLAVFAVGASPLDAQAVELLRERTRKGPLAGAELFYGRGIWNLDRMGLKDRMLCTMLLKSVKKRSVDDLEPWMAALLEAGNQSCDWTDPGYLAPLLTYLRAGA